MPVNSKADSFVNNPELLCRNRPGGFGVLTETGHIMFSRPSQLVVVVPLTTFLEDVGNIEVGGRDVRWSLSLAMT